ARGGREPRARLRAARRGALRSRAVEAGRRRPAPAAADRRARQPALPPRSGRPHRLRQRAHRQGRRGARAVSRAVVMTRRCLLALLLAGAGGPAVRAAPADQGELVVFAAASLRESFEALAASFEKAHAGVKVRLNLAGSQELRTQLEQGARAD